MKKDQQSIRVLRMTLISLGVLGALGHASRVLAVTFVETVQPTASSLSEPVWGQGITINIGASLPDASIPPTVELNFVGLRMGDNSIGSADRTSVYLHVYDGFGITAGGAVDGSAIGNLLGVSTNALNLETPAPGTDLPWTFSGGPMLSKSTTYYYIMADDMVAATSGDFSNLIYSDLVVGQLNPHAGGQHYRQTGDLGDGPTSHDVFFRVLSIIPEPSSAMLFLLGLLSWCGLLWRRRK